MKGLVDKLLGRPRAVSFPITVDLLKEDGSVADYVGYRHVVVYRWFLDRKTDRLSPAENIIFPVGFSFNRITGFRVMAARRGRIGPVSPDIIVSGIGVIPCLTTATTISGGADLLAAGRPG